MILAVLCGVDKSYFGFDAKKPYMQAVLNKAYSNFAKVGAKKGFEVIFTTWDLVKKGNVGKYWIYDKGWKQSREMVKPDYFFDKFDFAKKEIELKKKLSKQNKLINNYGVELFCKDKFVHTQQFSSMVPKTFLVKNKKDLEKYSVKIKSKKEILKPRYGHGGDGIIVFEKEKGSKKIKFKGDFVLQGLVDSSQGIPSLKVKGVHDLRCVIVNGKISYTYVREPVKGLLANIHQGGRATLTGVPKGIRQEVKKIDVFMKKFGKRIYSADFIYGVLNGKKKFFLLELNSKPGFDVCCRFGYENVENRFFAQVFDMLKKGDDK